MILASSRFTQLMSTFFPCACASHWIRSCSARISQSSFSSQTSTFSILLNEYQFCPSVQTLGFQCVCSTYQAFLSCGVSSGVLFFLLLPDWIQMTPIRGEVIFLLSFWKPGSSTVCRLLEPWQDQSLSGQNLENRSAKCQETSQNFFKLRYFKSF